MRRRLILLAVGLAVTAVLAAGSTQATAGGNGAAVVRDDGECFVADDTAHRRLDHLLVLHHEQAGEHTDG